MSGLLGQGTHSYQPQAGKPFLTPLKGQGGETIAQINFEQVDPLVVKPIWRFWTRVFLLVK